MTSRRRSRGAGLETDVTGGNPAAGDIDRWSASIDRVLAPLVLEGTRVALVNFPNHRNAGDPALWLAAETALAGAGAQIVHRASWATFDPTALRRDLGDGVVMIQAGGNFGDLYPGRQQATRERVLAELTDLPVVQLPQSMHFEDEANLERLQRLCDAHPSFRLLVRDQPSLDLATEAFDVPVQLCPDLTMALGPLARPVAPSVDVLWLSRQDLESSAAAAPATTAGLEVAVADWLGDLENEPSIRPGERLARAVNERLLPHREAGDSRLIGLDARTFDPLARYWTRRGLAVLAHGRIVVTDRLHGHLLALLMGIPHVVLDNRIGKIGAYVDTWSRESPLTHMASDPDEALTIARSLLAEL